MSKAVIDWLNFTFDNSKVNSDLSIGVRVRNWLQHWTGAPVAGRQGKGMHGFETSIKFYIINLNEEIPIAICAWGGTNQRGRVYVSLNGTGCARLTSEKWKQAQQLLTILEARITRVDVAVDALNGEFTVDEAAAWYAQGGFNCGGRNPVYRVEGDWLEAQGTGRSFYVGKRINGKYTRIYEKGKQLGDKMSDWTRFEVELHNVDRDIPHDVCTEPTKYFAGCFPCCLPLVEFGAERIATNKAEFDISLARLVQCAKDSYGKLINVLRFNCPDDGFQRLIDELSVEGVPRRLEKTVSSIINSPPEPGRSDPVGVAVILH